ncbi:hypothetical protein BX600DRAFT_510532 [Xylariales sp. PMI_506]|nr:hypothetical protein BX600DRAFT_510532 [Xylariales sp. PMI_506]
MPANEGFPPAKAQKTERSHEENQERAYIAASRRADRSLEARVQSARMASEIHRRRTGRGLKVTEEIVIKEEMYEEEEDELPRHYKYLTAHLQTNSSSMNHRVNAYISTQTAMATMARYNEINRLFNESFPNASTYRDQMSQSMYMAPLMNNGNNANTTYSPTSPTSSADAGSVPPLMGKTDRRMSTMSSISTTSSTRNVPSAMSPPALSPASGTTETPESRSTPYQTPAQAFSTLDTHLQHAGSSFTSELPNEVKLMANIDMNDPMAPYYFGGNPTGLQMFGEHPDKLNELVGSTGSASPHDSADLGADMIFSPVDAFSGHFDGTMPDGAWDSFVDFGADQ